MSRSALSARVFAMYLFIVGAVLLVAPNALLTVFLMAPTAEVWISLIGVLAVNIGVFVWIAARTGARIFLEASVYTRCFFFVVVTAFVFLGRASAMLLVFGAIDLAGATWTHFALRADARAHRSL